MKSETVQFVPAIDDAVAGKGSQAMKFLAGLKKCPCLVWITAVAVRSGTADDDGDDQS